jgi:hypothetical protein
MTATTMLWTKLARRMGCDSNPLRRRCDRIEAWLLPAAVVVFLALCPLVAGVSSLWTRADNTARQHAALSWTSVLSCWRRCRALSRPIMALTRG